MTEKIPYPLNFIIEGQPMSKKRNWVPLCGRGRPRIILSKQYKAWEKSATDQLWVQRIGYQSTMIVPWVPIAEPVTVRFLFFLKGHGKIDLSNLYQGPEDALVVAEILQDDALIESHDGSRKYSDHNDMPRVHIKIMPFKEEGNYAQEQ